MGLYTLIKLYIRSALLLAATVIVASDWLFDTAIAAYLLQIRIFGVISLVHVFWFLLMVEMLIVLVPKFNKFSYSGKHLLKHYISVPNIDLEKLVDFSRKNGVKALRSAVFWLLFNTPFAVLYFMGYANEVFFYWLFFFYYFFDVFSIQVFCIFHVFVTQNKCCNECRIFNWGHFMYCTPLLFTPNVWSYSLVLMSLVILIQWEIAVFRHPERFSPVSNASLQCSHCVHACRYNKNRRRFSLR